jgi:AcrR family transcriptional regulator
MNARIDRRTAILATSAELFAARGIASTTVRDIGEAAGLHPGSLYHHFASKHDIVRQVLSRYMAEIDHRLRAAVHTADAPADRIRGLIRETLRVIEDHPHPTAIYQNERTYLREHSLLDAVDETTRSVQGYWMGAIEQGRADGTFTADIPAEIFYRSVRSTLWSTMHWPSRRDLGVDELAELMIDLFFNGYVFRLASG